MAEKQRFVVHEHYVVDTKENRHAPFGEAAGAGVVADRLNVDAEFGTMFAWVEGKPKGFKREQS